jgi:signal transduction histidine kinase
MSFDLPEMSNALIIIISIVVIMIIILFFFVVLARKRNNYYLKEKELMESRYAQTLLQSQLEIQEQTFMQISGEIHDNIGQVLSLVRLNLNTLGNVENEEKLNATDELLGRAINDLRHLSHNLNTEQIKEAGLVEAVRKLVLAMEKTGRFQVTFRCDGNIILKEDRSIIVFRIIQEVVNNIVKHAEATSIAISIEVIHQNIHIIITDNGKGFDEAASVEKYTGVGIRNMKIRARMVNATLEIVSHARQGTIVHISLEK